MALHSFVMKNRIPSLLSRRPLLTCIFIAVLLATALQIFLPLDPQINRMFPSWADMTILAVAFSLNLWSVPLLFQSARGKNGGLPKVLTVMPLTLVATLVWLYGLSSYDFDYHYLGTLRGQVR